MKIKNNKKTDTKPNSGNPPEAEQGLEGVDTEQMNNTEAADLPQESLSQTDKTDNEPTAEGILQMIEDTDNCIPSEEPALENETASAQADSAADNAVPPVAEVEEPINEADLPTEEVEKPSLSQEDKPSAKAEAKGKGGFFRHSKKASKGKATAENNTDSDKADSTETETQEATDNTSTDADVQPTANKAADDATEIKDNQKTDSEVSEDNGKAGEGQTPAVSESEKQLLAEKERIKAEKRAAAKIKRKERNKKFRVWTGAHKVFVAIVCIVFILAVGGCVSHFVLTRNMAFIHDAEDLAKAVEKGKRTDIRLKGNVQYEGDLSLDGYNLDLGEYELKVNGNLSFKNKEAGYIGSQKWLWSKYTRGGSLVVSGDLLFDGTDYSSYTTITCDNVIICADSFLMAGPLKGLTTEATVYGRMTKAGEAFNGANSDKASEIIISTVVEGKAELSSLCSLRLNGKINSIGGGDKVSLGHKASVDWVERCSALYIENGAYWQGFDSKSIENYYFVQMLSIPMLLVSEKSDGTYSCRISQVDNADAYMVVFDGMEEQRVEKSLTENYTEYVLPYRDPGDYEISVYAVSNKPEEFNDGPVAKAKVQVYTVLDAPVIESCVVSTDENGKQTVALNIVQVPHATSYTISVNGKVLTVSATEEEKLSCDISQYVTSVGTYNMLVYASAPDTNYMQSESSMFSYVYTVELSVGGLSATLTEEGYKITWQATSGAFAYEVCVLDGEQVISSVVVSGNSYTLPAAADISVRPLGTGYYKDGEAVILKYKLAE